MNGLSIVCAIGTLFLSVQPVRAELLHFDDALRQILQRNTAVAIQQATLDSSRARSLPAKFAFTPSVSAEASRTTTKIGDGDAADSKKIEANARMNLFRFGADYSALRAANSEINSQEAQLDAALLRAEDAAVRSLITEIQRKKELEILARIVELQQGLLKIARARYDRGLLPLQEVEKLGVDFTNVQSRFNDAQLSEREAQASLLNLLDRVDIKPEWPWQDAMIREEVSGKLKNMKLVLEQVPAWKSALERVEAEDHRVDQTLRVLLPSLDGSFGYGRYFSGPFGRTGWTGALSVSVPIFDQLTNFSNHRIQVYSRTIAEQNLEQAARDARSEWDVARETFKIALESAQSRNKVVSISERIYRDNFRRFQAGRIDANDLSIDQNRLSDAQILAVQGWASAHIAFNRLCHALGRRVIDCAR